MQEAGASEVAEVIGSRTGELGVGGSIGSLSQREKDTSEFFIRAAKRLDQEEICVVRGLHDPIAFADSDEGAGLAGKGLRHGLLTDFFEDVGEFVNELGKVVLVVPDNHLIAFISDGLPFGLILLHDAIFVMRGTIAEDPGIR
jgi:hypothetical protein